MKKNNKKKRNEAKMGEEEDIFVKRVDFEVNNNEPSVNNTNVLNGDMLLQSDDVDDVEKNAVKKKPNTCCGKLCYYLDKFGIKGALSHIGLLLGLALYCFGGGWVSFVIYLFVKIAYLCHYGFFS